MTNYDNYKKAFSGIHGSTCSLMEERINNKMKEIKNKKKKVMHLVESFAVCVALLSAGTMVYASDLGGIQRKMQMWIHGDQTDVIIELDGNGGYSAEYTDVDGNLKNIGGGGVATNPDGTQRPLTEEEILEHLQEPVTGKEDGKSYIYWFDQKIDITDKFENGYCYIKIVHDDEVRYMTVTESLGYGMSENRYLSPWEFSVE